MRILLIGGSGFIGTRLARILVEAGHNVSIFDKCAPDDATIRYIAGDVRDVPAVMSAVAHTDTVYNLAAEHKDDLRDTNLYYEVNVDGMRNVIAACVQSDVRKIIFTSTVACYGLDRGCPDEAGTLEPFNDYGRSKLQAEELLLGWAQKDGNQAIIVRPAVVFGEANRGNVYHLLRQIYRKRFPMVGDGANRKSMAYVGNVADFLAWCNANVTTTEIFNYSDKPDLSTSEIVSIARSHMGLKGDLIRIPYGLALLAGSVCDMMSALIGKSLPFSKVRVMKFCAETIIDSSKAHRSGFVPKHSLERALHATIQNEFMHG